MGIVFVVVIIREPIIPRESIFLIHEDGVRTSFIFALFLFRETSPRKNTIIRSALPIGAMEQCLLMGTKRLGQRQNPKPSSLAPFGLVDYGDMLNLTDWATRPWQDITN